MSEINYKEADTEEMIEELVRRGAMPEERESDIDDFSDDQLRAALGIGDDADVDWQAMYQMFVTGKSGDAINEFKRVIEQKTGRIIV